MDKIEALRAFVRVVERRSFRAAAQDLLMPRARVSEAVGQLERQLGVRLLARTTRKVVPTVEGEEYRRRALGIIAAVEDADAAVAPGVPSGPLRIDVHGTFARRFLLPDLPDFIERYPEIRLHIGERDRLVDLIGEGVDCVIRVGEPAVSGLVGRRLGMLPEGTFASPAYLAHHGVPASPDDLGGHRVIGFVSSASREVIPLEFQVDGEVRLVSLPAAVTVTAAATNAALARLGLGLIQVPRYRVERELAAGELVEVLPEWRPTPTPVYLLYPEARQLSPRARLFIDWAVDRVGSRLQQTDRSQTHPSDQKT
ncbi:LysR family transcriptional regulator [Methylobacterium oryzisoli]|uniref:LysR family transcriptional regulator n=1 Tax=Methylobacterium oryzisoli TaxID=3385502 RepID=UPI003892B84F